MSHLRYQEQNEKSELNLGQSHSADAFATNDATPPAIRPYEHLQLICQSWFTMMVADHSNDQLLSLKDRISNLPLDPALARQALRIEMENYSENHWAASWLHGLEYELWQKVNALRENAASAKAAPEAYTCLLLSEITGGWWYWPEESSKEEHGAPRFIEMQTWLACFDAHLNHREGDL